MGTKLHDLPMSPVFLKSKRIAPNHSEVIRRVSPGSWKLAGLAVFLGPDQHFAT
jgi:hypothetical protein